MKKVFIDGSAGTTGLKIFERFQHRSDLELLTIPEELRKDLDARVARICEADISFLCLPDDASREICRQLPAGVRVLGHLHGPPNQPPVGLRSAGAVAGHPGGHCRRQPCGGPGGAMPPGF